VWREHGGSGLYLLEQAEIADLHVALVVQQQIMRLEVAVQHAAPVSVL
jgi:hypothetical protein